MVFRFHRKAQPNSLEGGTLEVAVAILVWAKHQQFEGVLIEHTISQQAQQSAHAEFEDLHPREIADFGFAGVRMVGDGLHRFIERSLLLLV